MSVYPKMLYEGSMLNFH